MTDEERREKGHRGLRSGVSGIFFVLVYALFVRDLMPRDERAVVDFIWGGGLALSCALVVGGLWMMRRSA